ncbi:MAG: HAD family phosphatase [Candidatus Buchananbacteria bacterium]
MVKTIIFDLDGVIVDSEKRKFDLLKILLKKRGIILDDADYKKCVGIKIVVFLKTYFGDRLSDQEIQDIFIERKQKLHQNPKKYIIAQPHAIECCKKLFDDGFVLAIASASDEKDVKLILDEFSITHLFKVIISSDLIKNYKPDPETYLKCIEKLQTPKQTCIAVEDSPAGVESAKVAGLICVAVTYTHAKNELQKADKIIESLDQLTTGFIKKLQ